MIDRLIPRYPAFLVAGLVIVALGLFFLTAGRDAMIAVWVNKLFDGETGHGLFKATQTADQFIGHTLTVWLFLGLSFIKLGIGFAVATIVSNLRATGRASLANFAAAGDAEAGAIRSEEPWFGRLFTRFLFAGILVMGFFFLLSLWWGANLVFLKDAQFDGRTTGAAYETYLMVERILDPLIGAGKFLGEGLIIFGILTGLATIIWHLSFQAEALPRLTLRALRVGDGDQGAELPQPVIPRVLIRLGILGFGVMALLIPLALVRSGFIGWAVDRQLDGVVSETAVRVEGILARTIDPLTNLGLGILFFTIAFLLLTIIRYLREQRRGFGEAVAELSNGRVPRPAVESALVPTRLIAPLAIFGIFVVGTFFFTMTGVRDLNFNNMLSFQFAGATDGSMFQNALRLDRMLGPIIGATRFIGIASLMLAIGLALVTIVINLRATAMLLPTGFSKLIAAARKEEVEEEDLTVYEPMALAPWDLFRPLVAGVAIVVSTTLPIAILLAVSTHRMLGEQFAGRGDPGATSGLYESSFLGVHLYAASLQPWMLFGMALILFSIGRFFTTIVGFVEARRMVIAEGTEAIAEALNAGPAEMVDEARKVNSLAR